MHSIHEGVLSSINKFITIYHKKKKKKKVHNYIYIYIKFRDAYGNKGNCKYHGRDHRQKFMDMEDILLIDFFFFFLNITFSFFQKTKTSNYLLKYILKF